MSFWLHRYRRARYGKPIVVVSGLPRSGTSMMMRMLDAGGMAIWTDGIRHADDHNPHGYYELERVKDLDKPLDKAWVREGRGRVVKIISSLLPHLPADNTYQVIFMHRDLDEVLASQARMLAARGEPHETAGNDSLKAAFDAHLSNVRHLLEGDRRFAAHIVHHSEVMSAPPRVAERIQAFLGCRLDLQKMAAVVDQALYRNRSASRP